MHGRAVVMALVACAIWSTVTSYLSTYNIVIVFPSLSLSYVSPFPIRNERRVSHARVMCVRRRSDSGAVTEWRRCAAAFDLDYKLDSVLRACVRGGSAHGPWSGLSGVMFFSLARFELSLPFLDPGWRIQ